ncbi:MAG TPA: NTPase [Thermoanaerobaculia bacterium]|nr:NTPase [Thermoanaerobaculia bacterium]
MKRDSVLLLTGEPGSGKTTVVLSLAEELRKKRRRIAGFVTTEIRKGRERVGFRIETFAGESAIFAHVSIRSRHRVSRYGVDVAALDEIVDETLGAAADVYLIDEIGKMECFSARFVAATERLLDAGRLVVATVALRGGGFIEEVKRRRDVELRNITRSNRDGMPAQILEWIALREGQRGSR